MEISLKDFFFHGPIPFTAKRDLNWTRLSIVGGIALFFLVLFLLFYDGSSEGQPVSFHEKIVEDVSGKSVSEESNPVDAVQNGNYQDAHSNHFVRRSLDYLFKNPAAKGSAGNSDPTEKQMPSMIIARGGSNNSNQLPAGSKMVVALKEGITIGTDAIPVMGVVLEDVLKDQTVAIASGAQIIGDASFNGDDRASITWKTIIFPNGRERDLNATSIDFDGHVGVSGNVKSDALKNSVGQTMTRFVGAYAEGSINRGAFGASVGGTDNGLRNAVAQTSKDRADDLAHDLSKERKWIELKSGTKFFAVFTQGFSFRDPGHTEGGN